MKIKSMLRRMLKIESAVSLLEERRSYIRRRTDGHRSRSRGSSCSKSEDADNESGNEACKSYHLAEQDEVGPWNTYPPWNTVDSDGETNSVHFSPDARGVWDESAPPPPPPPIPICKNCAFLESCVLDIEQSKLDLYGRMRELKEAMDHETERADNLSESEERCRNIITEKEAMRQNLSWELYRQDQQIQQLHEHELAQSLEIKSLKDSSQDMEEEHESAIFTISEQKNVLTYKLDEVTRILMLALTDDASLSRQRSGLYMN